MKKKLLWIFVMVFMLSSVPMISYAADDEIDDVEAAEEIDAEEEKSSDDVKKTEVSGDFKVKVSILDAIKTAESKVPGLYPVRVELKWFKKKDSVTPVWSVYLKESDDKWKQINIDAETGKVKGKKFKAKNVSKSFMKNK